MLVTTGVCGQDTQVSGVDVCVPECLPGQTRRLEVSLAVGLPLTSLPRWQRLPGEGPVELHCSPLRPPAGLLPPRTGLCPWCLPPHL